MAKWTQNGRITGKPLPGFRMPDPISSDELTRIDNRINPRSVTSWRMVGGAYRRNGQRVPGYLHLLLSGGGWIYFAENTPLDQAFDRADALGYDTAEARAKTDRWVQTGEWQ